MRWRCGPRGKAPLPRPDAGPVVLQFTVFKMEITDGRRNKFLGSKCVRKRVLAVCVALLWPAALVGRAEALAKMRVAYAWDSIAFRFDSEQQRQQLLQRGVFRPGDSVAFDIDVDVRRERVFVTMPHLLGGSAVTLATIERLEEPYNPRLVPYPNMTWHAGLSGCDGLTSVFRVQVDGCGRLWVVDSGDDLQRGGFGAVCPPQLLVFDLASDALLARQRFPRRDAACCKSLMLTVVTEQMGGAGACSDDVYAYVADAGDFALYVFHLRTARWWRVPSDYFFPEVGARDFLVAGTPFAKMVGVLGLALSPCLGAGAECDRFLFFHSFSGFLEGRVRTSVLRNASLFAGGADGARPYVGVVGRRHWQAVGQAMNDDGVLFFGQVGQYALNCWNMDTPYSPNYIEIIEYDYDRIRVQMGVKVIKYPNGEEELWSLSNNIQGVFSFDFTPNNTYPLYAIYGKVDELINGTVCDPKRIRSLK